MLTSCHFLYSAISITASSFHLFRKKQFRFVYSLIIIFLAWYIYLAPTVFNFGVDRFIHMASNLEPTFSSQLEKFTPKTTIKDQVDTFRFTYLFIYLICMIISGIIYKYMQIQKRTKELIKTCFYWIVVFTLFGFMQYGQESFERIYMFSIVPIICIITMSFSKFNKKILVFLMVLSISAHIPAHYGSEAFMAAKSSEIKGSEFFASKVDILTFYQPPLLTHGIYIYPHGGSRYISYFNTSIITVESQDLSYLDFRLKRVRFIIWGINSVNLDKYYTGEDQLQQWIYQNENNTNITLIYNNEGFKLYNYYPISRYRE